MHKVSCKGVPLGVGLVKGDRKYGLYSIKTITTMEFTKTNTYVHTHTLS